MRTDTRADTDPRVRCELYFGSQRIGRKTSRQHNMGRKRRGAMSSAEHKELRNKERVYDETRKGSDTRKASRARYAKKRITLARRFRNERIACVHTRLARRSARSRASLAPAFARAMSPHQPSPQQCRANRRARFRSVSHSARQSEPLREPVAQDESADEESQRKVCVLLNAESHGQYDYTPLRVRVSHSRRTEPKDAVVPPWAASRHVDPNDPGGYDSEFAAEQSFREEECEEMLRTLVGMTCAEMCELRHRARARRRL